MANVLALAERRGRINESDVLDVTTFLEALPISIEQPNRSQVFGTVLPLARTHRLTAYDAAYLDLALRVQKPLATLDKDLLRAAAALGVPTLPE